MKPFQKLVAFASQGGVFAVGPSDRGDQTVRVSGWGPTINGIRWEAAGHDLNDETVDGNQKSCKLHQLRLIGYPIIYRVLGRSQVVVWDFWTINRILQVRTWRISEQRFNVHQIVWQKIPPGLQWLGFCHWCFSLVAHYYHRHTMTQVLKKHHSYKYFHSYRGKVCM